MATSECSPSLFTYFWYCLTNTHFIHAVSGGISGAFAIVVFYPFEIARTRVQVDDNQKAEVSLKVIRTILSKEGIVGLYRGVVSIVVAYFSTNFVYFYVFHGSKAWLSSLECTQDACKDLLLGTIAGVIAVLLTNPLWVVNTRLKLQNAKMKAQSDEKWTRKEYCGVLDCIVGVVKYEGWHALWAGTMPSLVLVANPAIHFMSYETLKRRCFIIFDTNDLHSIVYFLIGAISKFIATIVTYPMQVVQSRMRYGSPTNQSQDKNVMSCFQEIIKMHGIVGLFRGLESKLSQTVLTAALMFLVYEKMSNVVLWMLGNSHMMSSKQI